MSRINMKDRGISKKKVLTGIMIIIALALSTIPVIKDTAGQNPPAAIYIIEGRVTDQNGNGVNHALVRLIDVYNGINKTTYTDSSGFYMISFDIYDVNNPHPDNEVNDRDWIVGIANDTNGYQGTNDTHTNFALYLYNNPPGQYLNFTIDTPITEKHLIGGVCRTGEYISLDTVFNFTEGDTITILDFTETYQKDKDGVNATYVRIWYNGEWHPEPGMGKGKDNNFWVYGDGEDIPDNFTLGDFDWAGGGLYYIEYYSDDLEGNEEYTHNQSHYVDIYPPTYTVEFGAPNSTINGLIAINCSTPMWINATDNESGAFHIHYSVWRNETAPINFTKLYERDVYDNGPGDENPENGSISVRITFNEGCFHEIKWYVEDCVGNRAPKKGEESKDIAVDCSTPSISQYVGKPSYHDDEGNLWVSCSTPIWFNATDKGCGGGAGVWKLGIKVCWNKTKEEESQILYDIGSFIIVDNGPLDLDPTYGNISYVFHFWQDCYHEPEIWAIDYVGNNYSYKPRFMVDCTPPNVTKFVGKPEYVHVDTVKSVDQQQPHGCISKVVFHDSFEDGDASDWTFYALNGSRTWEINDTISPPIKDGTYMLWYNDDDWENGSGQHNASSAVSPLIDCTGLTNVYLSFATVFSDNDSNSVNENFWVNISNDNGNTWHNVWHTSSNYMGVVNISISSIAAGEYILINFTYDDNNSHGNGAMIDNITVGGYVGGCDEISNKLWEDYQSFKPTIHYLDAISLKLCGPGKAGGAVTVRLYNSTYELVAENTTILGEIPDLPTWYQFHFEPTVELNPGQTYYIVVTSNASDYYWCYALANSSDYPCGLGRMDGYLYEIHTGKKLPFDWTFKTEYYKQESYVNMSTIFRLTVRDEGCMGGVGLNETFGLQYRIWWLNESNEWQLVPWLVNHSGVWEEVGPGWHKYDGEFKFMEECTHRIEIMAKDKLGNIFHYNQTHHVDESPPKIFKWHHGCHEEFAGGILQLLNESFEENYTMHPFPPAGWLVYNLGASTTTNTWYQEKEGYDGNHSAACMWTQEGEYQDEWLVTPAIQLQENPVFSFWHKAEHAEDDNAPNEIWITTTGYTPDDFLNNGELLISWNGTLPTDWTQVILDDELEAYENKTVWIAFRYQSTGGERWMIDYVTCNGLISVGRYMQPWDNITLEIRDMPVGECAVGLKHTEIFWRYEYEGELRPYGPEDPLNYYYGMPVIGKGGLWWWHTTDNITNLTFYEECRHDLYYYYNASDLLGNTINSTIFHQVYYVDQSEPIIKEKIHPPCYYPIVTNETIFYDNMEGVVDSPPDWTWSCGYPVPNYRWTQYEINATTGFGFFYWYYDTTTYHSPTKSAFHYNDTSDDPEHPIFDDWLITPLIKLPADAKEIELVFWEKNANMDRYMHHGVYISLAGKNPDPNGDGHIDDGNYTLLAEFNEEANEWTERHVDLTPYAGHAVYIAFRYVGNNSSRWWIDDVEIRAAKENPGFIRACAPIYLIAEDYPEAKAIDQKQEEWNNWVNIGEGFGAQTFTAEAEKLDAVELYLESDHETNVTVMIFQGTPMEWWFGNFDYNYYLGEVTKHIPPIGNPETPVWWQFHFVPSINLVLGEQYTIIAYSDYPCYWAYVDEDVYSGGCAWNLTTFEKLDWDFAFRTEYWTGEKSACESGIQHIFYKYQRWNESSGKWEEYPLPSEKDNPNVVDISDFYSDEEIRNFVGQAGIQDPYLWYIYNESEGIHFYENCTHRLFYWTKDNVCHHSQLHMQIYYVDDEIPIVEKEHPEHGYYTPVNVTVDPTFGETDYIHLKGKFHVSPYWQSYSNPDGWQQYGDEEWYKKQTIAFKITNNDMNHTLHLMLHIKETIGDDGHTFTDPYVKEEDNNTYDASIDVPPGETIIHNVTVYDYRSFWRYAEWEWWVDVENVTQYIRAGARINLTAYDPPAYKVVDQEQTDHYSEDELDIYSPPPLWDAQEFIPSISRLDAVQLLLRANLEGVNVTVTILDDPIWSLVPLGTATMYIPPTAEPQWYQFHFDPPIPLIPGKSYYIAVSIADEEGNVYWCYQDGDVYPSGGAWQNGNPASIDWAFKTEYYAGCPSGIENIYWRYEWNGTSYPLPNPQHPMVNITIVNGSWISDDPEIANYWWYIYNDSVGIVFNEECHHDLYYFAKDKVCHNSIMHHQVYYVDGSAPEVEEILPGHGAIGKTVQSLFEHFSVFFDNGWAVVNDTVSHWNILSDEPYFDYAYGREKPFDGRYAAFAWTDVDDSADTWLITPRLTIPEDGNLTFYYRTYDNYKAAFEVCVNNVSDAQTDTSAFIPVWDSGIFTDTVWRRVEIDLSKYAGQDVYIAFHCYYLEKSFTDYGGLLIDNVSVESIHRIETLLDDNVESGIDGWTIEDLTVEGSYWMQVDRIPVYYNASPAPSMWCGDPELGQGAGDFGKYGYNWNDTLVIKEPINLSDANCSDDVWLDFWWWLDSESPGDVFYVEISNDSINWTTLMLATGDFGGWQRAFLGTPLNISAYKGNDTIWIRFRFKSDDHDTNDNGIFIDNVSIYNSSHYFFLPLQTFDNPWENWTAEMLETSRWHIVSNDYHVNPLNTSWNHSWWCGDDATGNYLNYMNDALISPLIDLTNLAYAGKKVMLTFWHKYDMYSGDYGYVEVSTDGGTTWEPYEARYSGSRDWVQEFIDLSDYIGDTIKIRFRFYSNSASVTTGWYIDDIHLEVREITATIFNDNFEKPFPPAGWSIDGYYVGNSWYTWERYQTPEFSYAAVHGASGFQREKLITPVIHLPKFSNLTFKYVFNDNTGNSIAYVYVINDTGAHLVWQDYYGSSGIAHVSLWEFHDQDVQIQFEFYNWYYGSTNDYWAIEWINITSLGFLRACAPIWLNVTDLPDNECAVGVSALYWRYAWNEVDDGGYGDEQIEGWRIPGITNESNPEIADYTWWAIYDNGPYDEDTRIGYISFEAHLPENCTHDLYYFAKDKICHTSELHHERWYVDGTPPETELTIEWANHLEIPKNELCDDGSDGDGKQLPSVICINDYIDLTAIHYGDKPCIYPYNWDNATYYRWAWYNESSGEWEFWPTPSTLGAINGSSIVVSEHADKIQYNDSTDFWLGQEPPFGGWIYWMKYTEPFNFTEGCKHILYYFSKDDLCNTEEPNEWHVGVDDMPPTTKIDFDVTAGTVMYDEEENVYYFQNCTWFIINATDMPNDTACQTGIWYIDYTVWRWASNEVEIQTLTNKIVDYTTVYIDGEPAGKITSWIDSDGNNEWNYCDYMYVDWQGAYNATYEDGWYHVEGVVFDMPYYTITIRGVFGGTGEWEPLIPWTRAYSDSLVSPYEGIEYHGGYEDDYFAIWIHLGELVNGSPCGKYEIHWIVYDYNNMTAGEEKQDVAIDCTPPRTTKEFSEPYVEQEIAGGEVIHWVSGDTKIWLNATDDFIWDSGVKEIWYKFWEEVPILLWKCGEDTFEQPYYPGIMSESKHYFTVNEAAQIMGYDNIIEYFETHPTLDAGIIELYHWSVDNVSHIEDYQSSKQHLYVDAIPPTSRVIVPVEDPYNITETPFDVTVIEIEDDGFEDVGPIGVCKVEVYYNYSNDGFNSSWTGWILYDTYYVPWNLRNDVPNWTFAFDAPQGAGWYRFMSIAYDCLGNVEQPPDTYDAECRVVKDTEPPIVTKEYGKHVKIIVKDKTNPFYALNNTTIIKRSTHIFINATDYPEDDYVGIKQIFWSFDGISWRGELFGENGTGPRTAGVIVSAGSLPGEGLYQIFYYATDWLEHASEQRKQQFFIDETAPETSIEMACNGTLPVNITVRAEDNMAGVCNVSLYFRYSPDNVTWSKWNRFGYVLLNCTEWKYEDLWLNYTWQFIYNPDGGYYKPGYYEFYVYAEDKLGNAKDNPEITNVTAEARCYVAPIAEDFNADGHVDVYDLLNIINNWGIDESSPEWEEVQQYDLDNSGDIGLGDLIALIKEWTG